MSGNMYEFINKTPNPLAGECSHKCSYCYVEKMKTRYTAIREKYSGEPRLWPAEFKKKYKPSDTIFVCDCNDLFAENVPDEIIKEVLSYYDGFMCKLFLQTKNPVRVQDFRDKIVFN
jgi:DNA repair photolyase